MLRRHADRTSASAPRPAAVRALLSAALLAACAVASSCGRDAGGAETPAGGSAAELAISRPAEPQPANPGPRIAFEEPNFDFGSASDVEPLRHAFPFRNAGDQRLIVTGVEASCGCTTTSLSKTAYEPGETGAIETEWKPSGFGLQKKAITVTTNAKPDRTILSLSAQIEPFVALDPPHLAFGKAKLGTERTLSAALRCSDPAFEILGVTSTSPHFTARAVADAAGGRALEVTLLSTAPWGAVNGQVQIDVRGRVRPGEEPIQHRLGAGVNAQLFGEVELDRTNFSVGRVDPGAPFTCELQVTRPSGEPFLMLEARLVEPVPSTMSVRSEPLAGEGASGYRLIVSGETGGHLGVVRGNVVFRTDVPGEEERKVPIMGLVRALEPHQQGSSAPK